MGRLGRAVVAVLVLAGVAAGCSSDDDGDGDEGAGGTTSSPATTTTAPPLVDPDRALALVEALASDELEGRDDHTPGSERAQDLLEAELEELTEPLPGAPDGGYRWPFEQGTNLMGLIPGGDLAEEYVVLGAHYDHLGRDCRSSDPADDICNGAADNASGVAAALEVARGLAAADEPPRRSVIVALWDGEEDALYGSADFVAEPPLPLEAVAAYLNWDIQGTNLTASVTDLTIVVGAETGGPELVDVVQAATETSPLQELHLSLLFGQGRSDHAPFAAAGVPVVFFTDANNGCYHTAQDDLAHLDADKLAQQIPTGLAVAQELVATDTPPAFVEGLPPATFEDAVGMHEVVSGAQVDFGLFTPAQERRSEQYLEDLAAIVEAGEAAFDDAAVSTLLGGAVDLVEALSEAPCESYAD